MNIFRGIIPVITLNLYQPALCTDSYLRRLTVYLFPRIPVKIPAFSVIKPFLRCIQLFQYILHNDHFIAHQTSPVIVANPFDLQSQSSIRILTGDDVVVASPSIIVYGTYMTSLRMFIMHCPLFYLCSITHSLQRDFPFFSVRISAHSLKFSINKQLICLQIRSNPGSLNI